MRLGLALDVDRARKQGGDWLAAPKYANFSAVANFKQWKFALPALVNPFVKVGGAYPKREVAASEWLTATNPAGFSYYNVDNVYAVNAGANTLRRSYEFGRSQLMFEGSNRFQRIFHYNGIAPPTQSLVVVTQTYVLSFFGTGTITLSDTASSAVLVGTGANTRTVGLITMAANNLTMTLTGDVRYVNMDVPAEASEYVTFPTSWIPSNNARVDRVAEVVQLHSNIIALMQNTDGTLVVKGKMGSPAFVGGGSDRSRVVLGYDEGRILMEIRTGNIARSWNRYARELTTPMGAYRSDGSYGIALGYSDGNRWLCGNGGTVGIDTGDSNAGINTRTLAFVGGHEYLNKVDAGSGGYDEIMWSVEALSGSTLQAASINDFA